MKNTLLIFILILTVSCSKSDDSDNITGLIFNQDSFDTNRELWENSGVNNYSFTQRYSSTSVGGLPKLITIVIESKLDTIYTLSNLDENYSIEKSPHYKTIDEVFDFIINTAEYCINQINSQNSLMKGAVIEVEYDDNFHYPTKIICRGHYQKSIDGGFNAIVDISDFRIN